MPAAYRVYVLQNHAGRFYVGVTADVKQRLAEHNAGRSRWTRGKGPWVLRWQSEKLPLGDARRLENALKRQKGGSGFYNMTGLRRS
jgi:putative endonuclease